DVRPTELDIADLLLNSLAAGGGGSFRGQGEMQGLLREAVASRQAHDHSTGERLEPACALHSGKDNWPGASERAPIRDKNHRVTCPLAPCSRDIALRAEGGLRGHASGSVWLLPVLPTRRE